MPPTIRVADDAPRATIAQAIEALRGRQNRMPQHWHERRAEIGDEIDELVTMWLSAPA